jgi:hypothetical protein
MLRLRCLAHLKYVNAPNFEPVSSKYGMPNIYNGFIVHSKVFDGLKGVFPLAF